MIPITASTRVLVAVKPVDFRRQMDGLIAHCRQILSVEPMSGGLFVFINRSKTMVRVLVYDGSGFWLMTKRLSKGKFAGWPTSLQPSTSFSARKLMHLLQLSPKELNTIRIN